ncbi:hypothetical protein STCU_10442 [Strigomonas culicis]|uniref:Uncharacterized protein n=1 Tax=Strigomonas culicis TaxID=28005 RepID=S9TI51_9TRYP|nr:hypothetical protein STCU_10442 [Strigomonas culicis]|eukprot:EPY17747.1 hypothetical protein STCU_10442 [Strigomonas culicis]
MGAAAAGDTRNSLRSAGAHLLELAERPGALCVWMREAGRTPCGGIGRCRSQQNRDPAFVASVQKGKGMLM